MKSTGVALMCSAAQAVSRIASKLLLLLLRGYQLAISPYLGQRCRFYPSCSEYALQAVRMHGPARGSLLTARRLCKCHPWHAGGLDPVPEASGRPKHHPQHSS